MSMPGQQCTTDGWEALLSLRFANKNGKTILAENRHQGPLTVQRPLYPEHQVCHTYLLHPPGGVVGGDRLQLELEVQPRAAALITTPGATKFYRSGGHRARQFQQLKVDGGSLEWFPQDTIIHPGAESVLSTRVELDHQARFMGWEVLSLGLPSRQEPFDSGTVDNSLAIYRQGCPLLLDRLRINCPDDLDSPVGLRGFPVSGIFVATNSERTMVDQLRHMLPGHQGQLVGLTLMGELLVARYLGDSTFAARALFIDLWTRLRPVLLNRSPCPPRIWAT